MIDTVNGVQLNGSVAPLVPKIWIQIPAGLLSQIQIKIECHE